MMLIDDPLHFSISQHKPVLSDIYIANAWISAPT